MTHRADDDAHHSAMIRVANGGAEPPEVVDGYTLLRSRTSSCGYLGVYPQGGRFIAKLKKFGKLTYIGTFGTEVEAAVAVAKFIASAGDVKPEEEVADGHMIFRSRTNGTGYLGVTPCGGRFQARLYSGGKEIYIGRYDTAVEAAVAVAKHTDYDGHRCVQRGPQRMVLHEISASSVMEELALLSSSKPASTINDSGSGAGASSTSLTQTVASRTRHEARGLKRHANERMEDACLTEITEFLSGFRSLTELLDSIMPLPAEPESPREDETSEDEQGEDYVLLIEPVEPPWSSCTQPMPPCLERHDDSVRQKLAWSA